MLTASRRNIYLMLVLVMLMWSGNSVVAKAIGGHVPPFTLALIRWTAAALIILPFAWRHIVADRVEIARRWLIILFLGVIGVGCFNAFMYSGLRYTTAANSLLMQAAIPALVLFFDFLIFRTLPRALQIVGVIIAAIGVGMIIFRGDLSALLGMRFNHGDALVLCGVVLWALYTVLLRLRPQIDPLSFLAVTVIIGALCMAPFAAFELQHARINLTPAVVAGVGYIVIFPSIFAYALYNKAVAAIGAGDAGQVINLQPVFGALLAAVLLSEPIHDYHMIGMALIALGIGIPLFTRKQSDAARN